MKLALALIAATVSSASAFAPASTTTRPMSLLRVSSAPKKGTKSSAADLAADFEAVSPEDVVGESTKGGAKAGQAEVVLVGCGAPNRGMGWYHAIQMLEGR